MTTLCVDAGTTVIKAVLMGEDGRELLVARRPTAVLSPRPGWSEQDMSAVLQAVTECVTEAAQGSAQPVSRLAVTAQGDGAWLVDADGRPVRNAVLWNDARAADVVDAWTREGLLDEAFRRNGSVGNRGLPHAIMRWLEDHEPAALDQARHVVTCGSWLFGALTGVWGLHPSEASAPWVDLTTGVVSDELIELYGLSAWRRLVPPMLTGAELTQPALPAVAQSLGLAPGVPVTLAPYDVVATGAGGGAVRIGDAFGILGTTLCTGALVDRPDLTGLPSGLTLLSGDGPIVRAFPTLAGTGVVEWMRGLLGLPGAAEFTALAAKSTPGAGGVRVWPYFSPAGERAPFLDGSARGVIAGLSFATTPADLARATVEGLALVLRDCLDAGGPMPTVLTLSGGGSASDVWCQCIADVTGVPTVRVEGSEIGARGAMLHAAVAAGIVDSLPAAADAYVTRAATFDPEPATRGLFDDRYADFRTTRAALAERWSGWAQDDPRS